VLGIPNPNTDSYTYDAHGNTASMPHLSVMNWDWKDQLGATAQQVVNNGTPETTYYRYDARGQRVVKATETQTGILVAQRLYLGGYEVYREYSTNGAVTLERQTLHTGDGASRICLAETVTVDASNAGGGAQRPLLRYQLGNHLDSVVLELDSNAAAISYEEYYPYGSTSFQSGGSVPEVGLKRYRYTRKERDTESGFYYHGARCYVPWLGRWASVDPLIAPTPHGQRPSLRSEGQPQHHRGTPTGAITECCGRR
jgi:RHS repeat-associated protein